MCYLERGIHYAYYCSVVYVVSLYYPYARCCVCYLAFGVALLSSDPRIELLIALLLRHQEGGHCLMETGVLAIQSEQGRILEENISD